MIFTGLPQQQIRTASRLQHPLLEKMVKSWEDQGRKIIMQKQFSQLVSYIHNNLEIFLTFNWKERLNKLLLRGDSNKRRHKSMRWCRVDNLEIFDIFNNLFSCSISLKQVVDIMKTNVEKVLERDQKLSELDDRADALQQGASQFEQQAGKLKRKFWLQNLKMMIIMGVIGLIIVAWIGCKSKNDVQFSIFILISSQLF